MINLNNYIYKISGNRHNSRDKFLNDSFFTDPRFILETIEKHAPNYNLLNEREINAYQEMFNCVQEVQKVFNVFHKFNIYPQVSIVGGALYDSVLGLEPKDYDICVYMPSGRTLSIVEQLIGNSTSSFYQTRESEILRISQSLIHKDISSAGVLIEELLKQNFNIPAKLKIQNKEHYIFKYILEVFKVNHSLFTKNIDIIMTNTNCYNFINTFDFNLCKMCIPYDGERSLKEFLSNFHIAVPALYDLENKTMTVQLDKFQDEEIKYFLNKHYHRMNEKYPNYSLNFRGQEPERVDQYNQKYLLEEKINTINKSKGQFKI